MEDSSAVRIRAIPWRLLWEYRANKGRNVSEDREREMKLRTRAKQRQPTIWITFDALSHCTGMQIRDKHQDLQW